MVPTLVAAALTVIAGISSGPARPSSALEQPAGSSAPAHRTPDIDGTGRPLSLAANPVSPPLEAGDYRLSEGKVLNGGGWSPGGGTFGLSQDLGGSGPLQGLTLRLRAKKLLDKFDMVGGGSGMGPPRYAARKHLMLSFSKSF